MQEYMGKPLKIEAAERYHITWGKDPVGIVFQAQGEIGYYWRLYTDCVSFGLVDTKEEAVEALLDQYVRDEENENTY